MMEGPRNTVKALVDVHLDSKYVLLIVILTNQAGWHTTNEAKEKMCLTTRSALEAGKIWFAKDFFSVSLGHMAAKRRVRDELCRYSVIVAPPRTPFGPTRRTFSGKVCSSFSHVLPILI